MATVHPKRPTRATRVWGAVGYAALSMLCLAIALVVGWWISIETDVFGVRFDRAYYILLVILGLSAALILFGVMRSTATVTGKYLGLVYEIGGAAALFVIVVIGGFWLTEPALSFNAMIRLRYHGPPANREAFEAALSHSKLRVSIGFNSQDYSFSDKGEVVIWDISGRFRDGTLTADITPGPIYLVDHNPEKRIHFPPPDEALELKANLREKPEQKAAREHLILVLESVQMTLRRTDMVLLPAIEDFLADPTDQIWQHVLETAVRTLDDVEKGIELALRYEAKYGGLLGQPQLIFNRMQTSRETIQSQRITGGLVQSWSTRGHVLRNPPANSKTRREVMAWRDRLVDAYERVQHDLKLLVERLTPSA